MENSKEILKYLKRIEIQNQEILKQFEELKETAKDSASKLDDLAIALSSAKEISTFGFPDVWQTVTIKNCPDKDTFTARIAEEKIQIVEEASKVISHSEFFISLDKDLEADLVLVSAMELGFAMEGGYLKSIKQKAKTFGLIPFSTEMAPLLRLYCDKQPIEKINIMMGKPAKLFIEDNGNKFSLAMFCLVDDGVYKSLDIVDGRPDALYRPNEYFLFAKPRK